MTQLQRFISVLTIDINVKILKSSLMSKLEPCLLEEKASNYIVSKNGPLLSESTIRRILKKIKHSYHGIRYHDPKQKHNLAEALDFMEEVNKLPQHLILSTDESVHPLNLARKKA